MGKKFGYSILVFFILCFIFLALLWTNRARVLTYLLSKHFHFPVYVEQLEIKKNAIIINTFILQNPPGSEMRQALYIERIEINTTLKDLWRKPLSINNIELGNISLWIEFYNSAGTDNNWKRIIVEDKDPPDPKDLQETYLIKRLALNHLQVYLKKRHGVLVKFPVIPHLEFHNISNQTGFPLDEIEKALMHVVLKSIFNTFGLGNLLKTLNPFELVPKLFPFSFPFGGKENPEPLKE